MMRNHDAAGTSAAENLKAPMLLNFTDDEQISAFQSAVK